MILPFSTLRNTKRPVFTPYRAPFITHYSLFPNVLFSSSILALNSGLSIRICCIIFTAFSWSRFLLLTSPDLIPPFLPIFRSSSGLRSLFGIRFGYFFLMLLSGFVPASIRFLLVFLRALSHVQVPHKPFYIVPPCSWISSRISTPERATGSLS